MGVFQDESFFDAPGLALAARMPPPLIHFALPGQAPTIVLAPLTCYDFMNPTTTKPFTILSPYLSIPSLTKTLRPSYVAIPLSYAIVPLHMLQAPPPHSTVWPQPLDPTFWNVVERAVEHSVHGAAALAWLFSEIVRATPQKSLAPVRDDRWPPSCDSLDLGFLPPIPTEDDLLCMDMTELGSISSSDLYMGEAELAAAKLAAPKLLSSESKPPPPSSPSDTTLDTLPEGYLPGEDLSVLLQIPDGELYYNFGAAPPWPLNSSASAVSRIPSAIIHADIIK